MYKALFLIAHAANISVTLPNVPANSTNPIDLIVAIYRFLLGISGFLAISVIIYGAVKYAVSAGNASGLGEAKDWIIAALSGLALLAGAYIILRTINPELTILNLPTLNPINVTIPPTTGGSGTFGPSANVWGCEDSAGNVQNCYATQGECSSGCQSSGDTTGSGNATVVSCVQIKGSSCPARQQAVYDRGGWSGAVIPPGTVTDAQARALLVGVSVNRPSDCTTKGQTDCTSLDGFPRTAIAKVNAVAQNCGCSVVISGGTEAGHLSHGVGKAVLDIRGASASDVSKLDRYVYSVTGQTNKNTAPLNQAAGTPGSDGATYYWEVSGTVNGGITSGNNHYHVHWRASDVSMPY